MTTGERLVDISTLSTGTAEEHFLNIDTGVGSSVFVSEVILGDVSEPEILGGSLTVNDVIFGEVEDAQVVSGSIDQEETIKGEITDADSIDGETS